MNRPSFPLYASVNVTTFCNLDCMYCYMKPHRNERMSLEDFRFVIDELAEGPVFYVLLSGGEPFTHPDIQEMIAYACDHVDEVSLVTNGTLLSEEDVSFLRRRDTSNLSVQVSLDSIVDEENRLLRTVRSSIVADKIRELSDVGVSLSVGLVMSRHNYASIRETVVALHEYVRHFNIMVLQNTVNNRHLTDSIGVDEEDLRKVHEWVAEFRKGRDFSVTLPRDIVRTEECTARGAPCSAAFSYVAIDPDLRVRPCDRVTDVFIGDLREHSIRDIWESTSASEVRGRTELLCSKYR